MAYDKLFQYYAHEQFLPTFGNLENAAKLAQYTDARRTVFAEKLMLPIQMFDGADMLEFGPDTGENALVFAQWGAKLTLAEPNLRAHGQIRQYFERFGLSASIASLRSDDIEAFSGEQKYDLIDAEGFIYTVQPTSLWLGCFSRNLKPGGYAVVSYYETRGTFIELALKAIHSSCKALTSLELAGGGRKTVPDQMGQHPAHARVQFLGSRRAGKSVRPAALLSRCRRSLPARRRSRSRSALFLAAVSRYARHLLAQEDPAP